MQAPSPAHTPQMLIRPRADTLISRGEENRKAICILGEFFGIEEGFFPACYTSGEGESETSIHQAVWGEEAAREVAEFLNAMPFPWYQILGI